MVFFASSPKSSLVNRFATSSTHFKGRFTLDTSIFDSTSVDVEAFDFARVLQAYDGRNISTYFEGRYPVWRAGGSSSFTVRARGERWILSTLLIHFLCGGLVINFTQVYKSFTSVAR